MPGQNAGSLHHPARPEEAVDCVRVWFRFPHVVPVSPGTNHLRHLRHNLSAAGVGANLVTDVHMVAVAMEYQANVHANDTVIGRFPGLRWHHPLGWRHTLLLCAQDMRCGVRRLSETRQALHGHRSSGVRPEVQGRSATSPQAYAP